MNLHIPLVADIHFQPKVALACAEVFEKVRVNPGNFADGAKRWDDDGDSDRETAKRSVSARIPSQKKQQGQESEGENHHDKQAVSGEEPEQEEDEEAEEERRKREEDKRKFDEGHKRIEELLVPLIEKCKELKTAMRIGTNHG